MTDLFDSQNRRITQGKKIGTGGEGSVYEVPALGNDLVAKVYHAAVSTEKQAKLRGMVKVGDETLKRIAAWPVDIIQSSDSRQICGFLMPKVADYEPIHHLYSPSHRKQRFPDKDWAFLVNTARNVAAAFDTIHRHGHVIGDVNPNLVFVAADSIVKLIDCDSFQIFADGKYYLCEVGVPHFTPPELQNHSSFRGVRRTKNHDNFGLALLLFHILLMGRHPFSGVFSGAGDMPLEKSIAQFRYAFGRESRSKGMTPPPNSVTTEILPRAVTVLFERAFSEQGIHPDGRPLAGEWVASLDLLKGQLRSCGQNPVHKYFGGLLSCPWCLQEQRSGNIFFVSVPSSITVQIGFNVAQLWAKILLVESPGPAPELDATGFIIKAKPLPASIKTVKNAVILKKTTAIGLILGSLALAPKLFWIALFLSAFLYFYRTDDFKERKIRQDALKAAKQNLLFVQQLWFQEAGGMKFQNKLNDLFNLKTEFEGWDKQLAHEKEMLQQNLYDSQLNKFLDNFFLENFNIPGLGSTRKAILASFGIETAADVTRNKIIKIKGFNESLIEEMLDWRKGLERRFMFDSSKGVDPADIAALNQRFALKRKKMEGTLQSGPEELKQLRESILQKRIQLQPKICAAAQQVAQAEADLSLLG